MSFGMRMNHRRACADERPFPDLSNTYKSLPFLMKGARKEEFYHSYTCQRLKDQSDARWEYRHFLMSLVKLATEDFMDQATKRVYTSRICF